MTIRKIRVYRRGDVGYGCFSHLVDVTVENFVSETDDTITLIEQSLNNWGGACDTEIMYYKNIDAFVRSENERFVKHIEELRERHEKTLKMANEHRKGLTNSKSLIPF